MHEIVLHLFGAAGVHEHDSTGAGGECGVRDGLRANQRLAGDRRRKYFVQIKRWNFPLREFVRSLTNNSTLNRNLLLRLSEAAGLF